MNDAEQRGQDHVGLPRRDHRPAGRWEGNIPSQPFPSARSTHSTAGWPATAIFRSASPSNARRERRLYRSSACRLVPRKPITLVEGDLGLLQRAPPWRSKVAHSLSESARAVAGQPVTRARSRRPPGDWRQAPGQAPAERAQAGGTRPSERGTRGHHPPLPGPPRDWAGPATCCDHVGLRHSKG